jgi:hypothetical protein
MELLAHLFAHVIFGLDKARPPLREVVPSLEELRANPASVLAKQRIAIAAAPRIGSAMFTLFVFFIVSGFFSCGLGAWVMSIPTIENWPRPYRDILFLAITVLTFPLFFGATCIPMLMCLQGRSVNLGPEGVDISDMGQTVRCPWMLFRDGGRTLQHPNGRALIPIAAAAIPKVELPQRGSLVATGQDVRTSFLRYDRKLWLKA